MYEGFISTSAQKYGVPATWIQAIIETESSWNPTAYRAEPQLNDASYGLGQFLYKTAQGLGYTGTPEGLYDPATSIDLIGKFLKQLIARNGMDFQAVYSEYNSGSPTKWLTSTQVAANVARAVTALQKWTNIAVQTLTGNPAQAAFVMIIVGLFLMSWVKGKGK